MAKYIDGFVFVISKKNIKAYKKMAKEAKTVWRRFGALDYKECIGDDLEPNTSPMKMLTFPQLTKAKSNETVWFSFITYKSRKHRDEVNKKVEAFFSKKYKDVKNKNMSMPFDMKRMAYGGFRVEVG
ncbi:MAG TPA: DUF1428 domain-containing protein [Candidatus Paceibacterota bacterium]|nr:DUF1428 domain-containing protein [Candidatus Paceibacterota bacterium]